MPATVSPDTRALRAALGRFPSGVTVVSVAPGDGDPHGMTASSFMSVSLDPPLVAVGIARTARSHELLADADRFGVSVLAAGQEREALHFAGRPQPGVRPQFARRAGAPVLVDAAAWFALSIEAVHPAGDHSIVVGRVEDLAARADAPEPLAYHSAAFHRLAPTRSAPPDLQLAWPHLALGCWG